MNDRAALTQKDLDLVENLGGDGTDKSAGGSQSAGSADKDKVDTKADSDAGKAGADAGDKAADKSGEKSGDKSAKKADTGSIFDDIDDDDDEGDAGDSGDKSKSKDATKDGDKTADKSGDKAADKSADKGADEKDDKPADSDWRTSLADRLMKDQGDKLTATKFSKARDGILKDLARFKSQEDYMAAGYMARQKIRSGEYKTAHPGEGADDKEVAAWRKANDIPDEPTGYELPQIQGFKWDDEKPLVDAFLGAAHAQNLSRSQVQALARWQREYGVQVEEEMEERMVTLDREDRDEAHDDLRQRYGIPDFKPRMRAMDRLLKDEELLPDNRGRKLMEARYYDPETKMWRRVMNDPYIAAMFIEHAEYQYGDVGFTPNTEVARNKGDIDELEKMMHEDYDKFTRPGPDGKTPADRLLELKRAEEERAARRGRRAA